MSMQKQENGMSSCSSVSSLSNIALRNRTVSRDSVLYFSEDNALRDSLSDIQTYSHKKISCKRKNKSQKELLRKSRNSKTNTLKNSNWQIKDTIVVAPFHALKECFQNQIKELCGKKKLTNGFINKKDKILNDIIEIETLVPVLREDLIETDKNRLKRKLRSTSPEERNYCDCIDDSSDSFSEACPHVENNHQAEIDLRNDSDGSSIILEKEPLNKRPKRCLNISYEHAIPTTFSTNDSKTSRPQYRRKRKIKGVVRAERAPKLVSQTRKNNKNASDKKKKSCYVNIGKKTWIKRSQPRYHTRSVTKKEKEKKDCLLKMMRAQNEIITKLEDLESSASSKDQPFQEKKAGDVQTEGVVLSRDRNASNPAQGTSKEPPCVVLHPFDPLKRKPEENLSDYSSDESNFEPLHEEPEKTRKNIILNSEIQSKKNFLDEKEIINLENKNYDGDEQRPLEKNLHELSMNSLKKSFKSHVRPTSLGAEGICPKAKNVEELVGTAPESPADDFSLNTRVVAATIEPSVIVQEHHNEPSSPSSSSSDQREDHEPQTCGSPNQMELSSFCCSVQEPDQQNDLPAEGYIFGPRNDFTRLRESCEFSFGLSTTIQDDQEPDTGEYFQVLRD